ncbi:hypothetical protein BC629DRAFT_1441667 [Irpex lacteus]|nr:hypothetical protein BC629DRAFT_1441667 [Irpex lacteus]
MTLSTKTPIPTIVPSVFLPGATVTFTGTTPQSISVKPVTIMFTIIHAFPPFTKSVTLRVRSQQLGSEDVILKIYDPRFTSDRLHRKPYKPWNSAIEKLASTMYVRGQYNKSSRYDEPPDPEDLAGVAARDALWEACYRDTILESYENECRAYCRLIELQGTAIPRFLFSGTVLSTPPHEERAITIPAVVLEYIPNAGLDGQVVRAVDSFPGYGIVHNDLHLDNILFTRERVVIIDFGSAGFREKAEEWKDWRKTVSFIADGKWIRRHLERKNKKVWDMVPENVRSLKGIQQSPICV